jgi:hypothetical protein
MCQSRTTYPCPHSDRPRFACRPYFWRSRRQWSPHGSGLPATSLHQSRVALMRGPMWQVAPIRSGGHASGPWEHRRCHRRPDAVQGGSLLLTDWASCLVKNPSEKGSHDPYCRHPRRNLPGGTSARHPCCTDIGAGRLCLGRGTPISGTVSSGVDRAIQRQCWLLGAGLTNRAVRVRSPRTIGCHRLGRTGPG